MGTTIKKEIKDGIEITTVITKKRFPFQNLYRIWVRLDKENEKAFKKSTVENNRDNSQEINYILRKYYKKQKSQDEIK